MGPREKDLFALVRAHDGDMRALGELYDRHTPVMHALATAIVGAEAEADEVVREVWLAVWGRALQLERRSGSVAAWLVIATRDRALERVRRRGEPSEAEKFVAPGMRDARPAVDGTPEQIRAREAAAALAPLERDALRSALLERLGPDRVAERLEVPVATVREWTRASLERLGAARRSGQPT